MLSLSISLKPNAAKKPEPPTHKRVRRKIDAKTKTAPFRTVARMCGSKGALNL